MFKVVTHSQRDGKMPFLGVYTGRSLFRKFCIVLLFLAMANCMVVRAQEEPQEQRIGSCWVDNIQYNLYKGYYAKIKKVNAVYGEPVFIEMPEYIEYDNIEYPVVSIENGAFKGIYAPVCVKKNKTEWPNWLYDNMHSFLDFDVDEITVNSTDDGSISVNKVKMPVVGITDSYSSVYCPKFRNHRSLREVLLSPNITNIDYDDFDGCYALKSITMGVCLESIGYSFKDCEKLETVNCTAVTPPTVEDSFYKPVGQDKIAATLHVPYGTLEAYQNAPGWKDFEFIYDDIDLNGNRPISSVIEDDVVYGLYLDDKGEHYVKVIRPVDSECTSISILDEVNFDGRYYAVTSIGDYAFMKCKNLQDVYLGSNVKKIGNMAFYECNAGYFYLPETVEWIGDYAFYDCFFVYGQFPKALKWIGDYAFCLTFLTGNGWLTENRWPFEQEIFFGNNLQHIGDYAFDGNNLLSVVIPSSVTELGEMAFAGIAYGWAPNRPVEFLNPSLTRIGKGALGCITTSNFEFPKSVEKIGAYTDIFSKEITLGENVKVIQPFAFTSPSGSKPSFVTIVNCLADTPPLIWSDTFSSDVERTLHVKKGLKSVYSEAEGWKDFSTIIDDIEINNVDYKYGDWTFRIGLNSNTAAVTDYAGACNGDKIVIPDHVTYNSIDYPVTTIDKWAVKNYGGEIEIPASVKEVKEFAFSFF